MMKPQHLSIKFLLIATIVLFGGMTAVLAQTGFSEPGDDPDLPVPIATTDAGQTMESVLGVGVTNENQIPDDVSLFVRGSTSTKDGPYATAGVRVFSSATGTAPFRIVGPQVQIGDACPNGARVCVIESTDAHPAVAVVQETGIGLFGETQAAGKAGVYGEGYYGIHARTSGNAQAIPLVGQSCTENEGACIAPFGTAGFFEGDFVAQKELGVITGDGRNLYRVASLYNKEEDFYHNGSEAATPEDQRSDGLAYKSFGVLVEIELTPSATENITSVVNQGAGEKLMSIVASEGDGTTWWPSRDIAVTYNEATNVISLENTASTNRFVQLIVSYLK